jgi:hypothetical protein
MAFVVMLLFLVFFRDPKKRPGTLEEYRASVSSQPTV